MTDNRLLFDADCGFCRWAVEHIASWDRSGTLRIVEIQSDEGDELLAGVDPERAAGSWHLVTAGGRLHSAGAVVAPLAELMPHGRPVAAIARRLPRLTDRVYRLGARNRTLLGRLTRRWR